MGKRYKRPGDRLADVIEGVDKGLARGLRGKKRRKSAKRRRRNERQISELSAQVTALTHAVTTLTTHVGARMAQDKDIA
ncbi:hypothetical protein [Streptomyces sp. NPDC093594]|uniref:hypothetical protein n=1 Tax=Streptomyces sp. NPDC093594 TaxID=3155305 RepID=UPI003450F169